MYLPRVRLSSDAEPTVQKDLSAGVYGFDGHGKCPTHELACQKNRLYDCP